MVLNIVEDFLRGEGYKYLRLVTIFTPVLHVNTDINPF